MKIIDTQRILDFYTHYIEHHGVSAGWSSMDYALQLYDLSSNCSYQHWPTFHSVLDVGSGEGHFKKFLRQQRQFTGQYTGLEMLPEFHKTALEKYSQDEKVELMCEEFLEYDFGDRKFDWVFSLGSLSVKQENLHERDLAFCKKMAALSRFGLTIYLNDEKLVNQKYLDNVNNLAVHNIDNFLKMLGQNFSPVILQVERMLPTSPFGVIIQMIWPPTAK